jgi:hypothetical protein
LTGLNVKYGQLSEDLRSAQRRASDALADADTVIRAERADKLKWQVGLWVVGGIIVADVVTEGTTGKSIPQLIITGIKALLHL